MSSTLSAPRPAARPILRPGPVTEERATLFPRNPKAGPSFPCAWAFGDRKVFAALVCSAAVKRHLIFKWRGRGQVAIGSVMTIWVREGPS
jgi:hypothetical protein